MHLTWDQVFAWRLRRQFVTAPDDVGVTEIVGRLCGVQAQVTAAADLAVALRRRKPDPGALLPELAAGSLMKTWAMRGTLHALAPDMAAAILSLIGSARTWEKPAWQRTFGASPAEVAALADAVARVLDGVVLSRDELVDALLTDPAFHRLGAELRSGWGALLKPLAWQGALCHGPAHTDRAVFPLFPRGSCRLLRRSRFRHPGAEPDQSGDYRDGGGDVPAGAGRARIHADRTGLRRTRRAGDLRPVDGPGAAGGRSILPADLQHAH
ncbi:crosslink repair DNA glycosylase YcaQ family protein [Nocardia sp. NPDC052112]|uniref:DNA glycosylase AlkZ-like family protein n=1 Tax=Nocardia sp. NPDC052112 TaxID=3155646 RepID=UPI003423EE70